MKRSLLIAALGIAFAGVSLWVVLSRGRSAKAVRAKFRLGGALITAVGLTTLTSCTTSCYDPYIPDFNQLVLQVDNATELRNGQKITIAGTMGAPSTIIAMVLTPDDEPLQYEEITPSFEAEFSEEFALNVGTYTGAAKVIIEYFLDNADLEDNTPEGRDILGIQIIK